MEAAGKNTSLELEPKNVMEELVANEIEAQLPHLSPRVKKQIKVPQIMAHALNRLPSWYVTSEAGWRRQWDQGTTTLSTEVRVAVRQGIAAVQRDPLRAMSSIEAYPPDSAEVALGKLRKLLGNSGLTWQNLVPLIQKLLVEGKMNFPESLDEMALDIALNLAERASYSSDEASKVKEDEDECDWEATF